MEELIDVIEDVENKPEVDQSEVDKLKEQIIEQIRYKDPRLYFRIKTGQDYKPWMREDYFSADINNEIENITFKRKIYRNELCSCNSGKKVKNCCGIKTYYTVAKEENKHE